MVLGRDDPGQAVPGRQHQRERRRHQADHGLDALAVFAPGRCEGGHRCEILRPGQASNTWYVFTVLLRDIMTEQVVTASPATPVHQVAELMRDRNVGSVVLADEAGRPVGMVTDRDLTITVLAGRGDAGAPAEDCATSPVVTGEADMALEEAAGLMVSHRIRRLPVMDGDSLVAS